MSEHFVRALAESEFRAAHDVFSLSILRPIADDERWEQNRGRWEAGRAFGAFVDGELSGAAMSSASELAVPGGKTVPAAAVSGVGVRAGQTRRGLLTSLMRAQLADLRERGDIAAVLHASESGIYGRFGYGVATRARRVSLQPGDAELRPGVPAGGTVRVVDEETAAKLLPEIYRRAGLSRPGMVGRNAAWWRAFLVGKGKQFAVHTSADGFDDGFVHYTVDPGEFGFRDRESALHVGDLVAGTPEAHAGLWRFLLSVDLVDEVIAILRPLDEPLEWMLEDFSDCEVTEVADELWLRLVDVPAALEARSYGEAEPVVIEVRDAFLPENSGNYRLSASGVKRTTERAAISMDADILGSLYLGDVSVSTLASVNRLAVYDDSALVQADKLFATRELPWCGTNF